MRGQERERERVKMVKERKGKKHSEGGVVIHGALRADPYQRAPSAQWKSQTDEDKFESSLLTRY